MSEPVIKRTQQIVNAPSKWSLEREYWTTSISREPAAKNGLGTAARREVARRCHWTGADTPQLLLGPHVGEYMACRGDPFPAIFQHGFHFIRRPPDQSVAREDYPLDGDASGGRERFV